MLKSLNMETPAKLAERSKRALMKAVRLCGSTQDLAKKIGITKQHLNYWKSGSSLIPYDIAARIFIITKGQASIYELRPDLTDVTKEFIETSNLYLPDKNNDH